MNLERRFAALRAPGALLYVFAIVAIGVETLLCAGVPGKATLPFGYDAIPVIPFLPPVPWAAIVLGTIWILLGLATMKQRSVINASALLGALWLAAAMIFDVPKASSHMTSIALRTAVFQPIAIAGLAWMLPGRAAAPAFYTIGRYAVACSLVVFGVDHALNLSGIGQLIPAWIPFHIFWVGFFGASFIAAGVAFATGYLLQPAGALLGLMFAIWLVTLHLPRTLGVYGTPGAFTDPAEWSSLFIAIAMWGGPWAVAGGVQEEADVTGD